MPFRLLIPTLDRRLCRWVPCLAIWALSGCSTVSYYGQLADGQLRLLAAREPVAEVVADRLNKVVGVQATETHIAFRAYSSVDLEAAFSLGD